MEGKLRCILGEKVAFERVLKKIHGPQRFYAPIYGISHTRTKEANGVHRISGASEWNIQISGRSSGVAVGFLNRREEGRDDFGEKIVNEFKHKYPNMKLINISDSECL